MSTLIVFGGLPGTGKTTIAKEVVDRTSAVYLRIDTIEQAIRSVKIAEDIGPAGYMVAYELAKANLLLGRMVVADCVNPLAITRSAWRSVALSASSRIIEVELICSDAEKHRSRAENRLSDIPGLAHPAWPSILAREYEPWSEPHEIIDTASLSPTEAAGIICAKIDAKPERS